MSVDDATPRLRDPFAVNAYQWATARVSQGVEAVTSHLVDEGQSELADQVENLFDSLVQLRFLYIILAGERAKAWQEGFDCDYEGDGWPPNPYRASGAERDG